MSHNIDFLSFNLCKQLFTVFLIYYGYFELSVLFSIIVVHSTKKEIFLDLFSDIKH